MDSSPNETHTSDLETLGQYLRRQREMRKIGLEEISRETKIHINLLASLEMDDYDQLPGRAFVKGFLKAYTNYVGLDTHDIMLRYEMQARSQEGAEKTSLTALSIKKLWGSWSREKKIVVVAVGVLLLALLTYVFFS